MSLPYFFFACFTCHRCWRAGNEAQVMSIYREALVPATDRCPDCNALGHLITAGDYQQYSRECDNQLAGGDGEMARFWEDLAASFALDDITDGDEVD